MAQSHQGPMPADLVILCHRPCCGIIQAMLSLCLMEQLVEMASGAVSVPYLVGHSAGASKVVAGEGLCGGPWSPEAGSVRRGEGRGWEVGCRG